MAFTVRFPIRFDHVDHARLVYFPRFFGFCHDAFDDFFGAELGLTYAQFIETRQVGFPVVHAESDFKRPFRFGDKCRLEMETAKVGTGSATHRYRFFLGEESLVRAEVRITTAAVRMEPFGPTEVPSDVREAFDRHLSGSP